MTLNIQKSDFEQFAGIFMALPLHVMFNTTYWCDSECPHCHYNCSKSNDLHKILPEQDIEHFLSEFKNTKVNIDSIAFSGGEITAIEDFQPEYIARNSYRSLLCGFWTTVMTNGSWINKPNAEHILNMFSKIYEVSGYNFEIQMSFDSYHKNCVQNANKIIPALDSLITKRPVSEYKYPFSLTGFKHEPDFKNKLQVHNCKNLDVYCTSNYDLNPVGRAKTNNLPNCRDTKKEFEKFCGEDKLKKLIYTPIIPAKTQNGFKSIMILTIDCLGNAELADAHNPENYNRFKTPYKKQNGEYKPFQQIKAELAMQLVDYVYGQEK